MLEAYNENLIHIFEHSFTEFWDYEAISDYGTSTTFTYGQLAEQIAKLHILFEDLGIEKGDKIALMGKNSCNWVIVYLAAVTYGAVIVPILQDFKENDALHIVNHSESVLFFVSDSIWEGMDIEQTEQVKSVFSLNNFDLIASRSETQHTWHEAMGKFSIKFPNGLSPDIHYDSRSNAEIASINYTSGTTGFSKGVVTPCNALAGNIKLCLRTKLVFPKCRQLAFLPLAHAYGCAIDFLGCLAAGGHSFLFGKTPTPKILLQAFHNVRPTLIITVPLILEKIYKKQIAPLIAKPPYSWVLKIPYLDEMLLNKIKQHLIDAFGGQFIEVIVGGAPLNEEVELFLHRIKFPVSVGYGMTETAPLISFTDASTYKSLSCGQVIEGIMEMRIDTPNEYGIGEVQVRGENVMLGYYKNDEATKETFTSDGWLKTGDLGYIDDEGFLFLRGRNKTMLLGANGQNIYPEEIEAKLNNMPYVMESLVIQQNERLIALVYPDYEAGDVSKMSHEQMEAAMENNRKQLNAELASYEKISKIRLFPHEFEKTPKKSIKRFLYTTLD